MAHHIKSGSLNKFSKESSQSVQMGNQIEKNDGASTKELEDCLDAEADYLLSLFK